MTCFALGAKCASPGSDRDEAASAGTPTASAPALARRSSPMSEAKAAQPTALAPWLRNWRRVSYRTYSSNGFMMIQPRNSAQGVRTPTALFVEDLVQVHQAV